MGILVQIPVFFGLLYVIRAFAGASTLNPADIYSFVAPFASQYLSTDAINHWFLGVDLLTGQNRALTIVGGILIYFQSKLIALNQSKAATPQT